MDARRPRRKEAPVYLRIPNDFGRTANDFGGKKIDCTTNHSATALPDEYSDNYVWFINTSAAETIEVAVSKSATAEVDRAAATGSSLKVGVPIPPRTMVRHWMPRWRPEDTAYLIAEATGAATLYLQKGSE
jgi:hypothetical protein